MVSPAVSRKRLLELLGEFPERPPDTYETLESVELDGGVRYLIEFTSEYADGLFERPKEKMRSYLFVPNHKPGQRLPAMVAIHQDGPRTDLGKAEPAGLDGTRDQHYGLELFQRGYVVVCPDRLGHADRRALPGVKSEQDEEYNAKAQSHLAGQLLLAGRTEPGKEAYDLTRATDILCSFDYVDTDRIGAIGHSAGGYALVYFMFVDNRVKIGVSSCGFFELLSFYSDSAPMKRYANSAIPGLAKVGRSADYVAFLAPRPFLMTRGVWEWGDQGNWKRISERQVAETTRIDRHARKRYEGLGAGAKLRTIFFDEDGGNHTFPCGVREKVYEWLDSYLKPQN